MTMFRIATLAVIATSAAGLSLATPASATADTVPSRFVRYHDLDLGSPSGRQTLDRRIRIAVHAVCPQTGVLDANAAVCRTEAQARAVADLGRAGIRL